MFFHLHLIKTKANISPCKVQISICVGEEEEEEEEDWIGVSGALSFSSWDEYNDGRGSGSQVCTTSTSSTKHITIWDVELNWPRLCPSPTERRQNLTNFLFAVVFFYLSKISNHWQWNEATLISTNQTV